MAARYDRKIAGAYLLLHYPSFGQGIDQNGAKLDNVYLAQRILDKLEAASGVAIGDVPSELAPGQDPNQTAWRLEVQGSAGGQQQGFVDRLRYLDSLKVRGMLLPERAILEGQHGTLAESQSWPVVGSAIVTATSPTAREASESVGTLRRLVIGHGIGAPS